MTKGLERGLCLFLPISKHIYMEKLGRKPSSDPAQEKLRQTKSLWNKDVSVFINDLIHLKKTMNGWPSKFHQERSFIKEPIPADPVSIIGVLSGDFQELAQRGDAIVQEQLNYAKTRRKKQPKQLNLPLGQPEQQKPPAEPEAPKPDLSQQLALPNVASMESDIVKIASAFEIKYGLTSQASNPVSRFFAKLLNPTMGFSEAARIRRVRMQLLNSSANTYKKLEKFQVAVVKSSKSSIETANNLMHEVWRDWETVRTGFNTYKAMMPPAVADAGGEIETPKEVEEIKKKDLEGAKTLQEKTDPSDSTNEKMDKINRAIEENKPEPDDADYEKPSNEEGPDWTGGGETLMDNLHEQQTVKMANWAKSDYQYAIRHLIVLDENNIDLTVFEELSDYIKRFSLRNRWAPMVVQSHKQTLEYLNERLECSERSFKDLVAVLKERKATENKILQEKKKMEIKQFKDQQKQERKDQKDELQRQRIELQRQKDKQKFDADQRKIQQKQQQQDQKTQEALEKAKQKALLTYVKPNAAKNLLGPAANDVAPQTDPQLELPGMDSGSAQDQLEVTAQAFLQKWLGKTRHQLSIFDQTSSQRLQIFEVAEEMRKAVDDVMDHLEKDMNVQELGPMVDKVNRQMTAIRAMTRNLHQTHPQPKKKK